jgi:hypothetical protein
LRNPLPRKTLARRVTIAQACHMMDVDIIKLLEVLNARREEQPTTTRQGATPCGNNVIVQGLDNAAASPPQKDVP